MTKKEQLASEKEILEKVLADERTETQQKFETGKLVKIKGDHVLSLWTSHIIGITISIIIGLIFTVILGFTQLLTDWWLYPLFATVLCGFSLVFIYLPGLVKIKTAHHGVMKIIESRIKLGGIYPVLPEGLGWVFPFLMGIIQVNQQTTVQDFPSTAKEDGIVVPVLALGQDMPSPDGEKADTSLPERSEEEQAMGRAEMLVRIAISFKTYNSYQSLSISDKEREDGIRNEVISILRYIGTLVTDEAFMCFQDIIGEIVEEVVDRYSKHSWGQDVTNLVISKSVYKDPEMNRILEGVNREARQRVAERLQQHHALTLIEESEKRLKKLDPALLQISTRITMTEQGKAQTIYIEGSAGDLVKAGTLAGGILGKSAAATPVSTPVETAVAVPADQPNENSTLTPTDG